MRHTQADLFKLVQIMDRLLGVHTRLGFLDYPDLTLISYPGSGLEPMPEGMSERIQNAYTLVSSKTQISIPYLPLQLQDFPFMFETRMTVVEVPETRFVTLGQIDRHDAVMCHLLKNNRREIAAIEKMGRSSGLSYEGLIDAFCAIDGEGRDTRRLRQNFLNLVEYLFGGASVAQAVAVISERTSF